MAKAVYRDTAGNIYKDKVETLREKIASRKAERQAEQKQRYEKMRLVAEKVPEKLEKHLCGLADKFASMAEGVENLRENLGLVRAAKNAPMKIRVAATRNYAKSFQRIAEESPERLENALVEAYHQLNDIANDIEVAAEQMGLDLNSEVQEVAQDIIGEAEAEGESPEFELEEKAEGEEPEPEFEPEEEEEANPFEEKAAAGEPWLTDKGIGAKPNLTVEVGRDDTEVETPKRPGQPRQAPRQSAPAAAPSQPKRAPGILSSRKKSR